MTNLAREVGTEIVNGSHHLSVMKDAQVLAVERDDRFMIYALKRFRDRLRLRAFLTSGLSPGRNEFAI